MTDGRTDGPGTPWAPQPDTARQRLEAEVLQRSLEHMENDAPDRNDWHKAFIQGYPLEDIIKRATTPEGEY